MAPEQAIGEKCDSRTDIFAFGRVLRQLLPDEVPEYVQAVINRCDRMDPSQRFASVSELRKALYGHKKAQKGKNVFVPFVLFVAIPLLGKV